MAKNFKLTRDEAEYIVDVLESLTVREAGPHWRALYLASELRDVFGMRPLDAYEEPPCVFPDLREKTTD